MSVEVSELVDREREMAFFCAMLEGRVPERALTVTGRGGMGKTSLLRLFKAECRQRGVPVAWVDLRLRPYNLPAHSLARHLGDEWGAGHFARLEQTARQVVTPALGLGGHGTGVHIGQQAHVEGTHLERVAGGSIFEGPVNITAPAPDPALARQEAEARLSAALRADLTDFTAQRPAVCILDHWEDAGPEVDAWLLAHPLHWLREGHLERLVLVVGGQRVPALDDPAWRGVARSVTLGPLAEKDYWAYAHCIRLTLSVEQLTTIYQGSGGVPLYMSIWCKNLAGEVAL